MGSAETEQGQVIIYSHIIIYGNAATPELTEQMRDEIETMWNEPVVSLMFNGSMLQVRFQITSSFEPGITDIDIYQNTDPRNNYFRIEEFAAGNISFVDGLGCNSGYFKLENLYQGSTTAAHEYGHTIGLDHPDDLDLRGKGVPGIMYPRGTLVDPQYQYDPEKPAGMTGGTMHPRFRRVQPADIEALKLHRLDFINGKAIIGDFTNYWHPDHSKLQPGEMP
jgi:hypothetical protein